MNTYFKYVLLFLFFGFSSSFAQFKIPEKPKKKKEQTSVYDYVNLLTTQQKQHLETKLIQYSDTTSTQIVVAIINSTNNESIGLLAPRWAHKWGVGQEKQDNGIFILLAKNDREVWIAPGYGVEHILTAGINGQIVRNYMIPEFKKGNYYQGLNNASNVIFELLKGTYKGSRIENDEFDPSFIIFLVIFIVFIIIISRANKNNGGHNLDSRDVLDTIILSNAGRGGWFSGGGEWGSGSSGGWDSGGFGGGFGGGGFSGGGAGGDW